MFFFNSYRLIPATILALALAAPAHATDYTNNIPEPVLKKNEKTVPCSTGPGAVCNGIRFDDYRGFEEKWKFVTFTYRDDINELRLSYANPIAYKTLLAGETDYPDGSVFGKIALNAVGDPAFNNSKTPSEVRRFQIMVRDKKKYPETDGWGYAIFDAIGWTTDPDKHSDPQNSALNSSVNMNDKCHSCHEIVKNRGYVFSKIPNLKPYEHKKIKTESDAVQAGLAFKTIDAEDIPSFVKQFVPEQYKNVRVLNSVINDYTFIGMPFELRPILITEAMTTNTPAAFFSDDGVSMIVVSPTDNNAEPIAPACNEKQKLLVSYWTIGASAGGWPSKDLLCYNGTAQ